jgi:hypothetical protein
MLSWSHFAMMLVGNVVAIGVGAFVNNMAHSRQYPTYWGMTMDITKLRKNSEKKQL